MHYFTPTLGANSYQFPRLMSAPCMLCSSRSIETTPCRPPSVFHHLPHSAARSKSISPLFTTSQSLVWQPLKLSLLWIVCMLVAIADSHSVRLSTSKKGRVSIIASRKSACSDNAGESPIACPFEAIANGSGELVSKRCWSMSITIRERGTCTPVADDVVMPAWERTRTARRSCRTESMPGKA